MDKEIIANFQGKHVKVTLNLEKQNFKTRVYSGRIIQLGDDGILFKDKFNQQVYIKYDTIQRIDEINGRRQFQ